MNDCGCPRRHEHGTMMMYEQHACRCFPCRLRSAERRRETRHGRRLGIERFTDATGTVRRLQALAAAGVPLPVIAARLGVTNQAVDHARARRNGHLVRVDVAQRVREAYDELWNYPTPSRKTRTCALRRGWLPPMAWDDGTIDDPDAEPYRERYVHAAERGIDEVAVAEAVAGRPVRLTPAERAEVVLLLTARGYSAAEIADRLGTTQRTVTRRRSGARTAAA